MVGRRSVWSNPEIIKLAEKFVPATDEVWRLQRGDGPECRYFQNFADHAHYRRAGGTRQGIYVCTAAGELLGSLNSNDPAAVAKMLRASLEKWSATPEPERRLPKNVEFKPAHRWEDSFPKDGLVLLSANRDLPADGDPSHAAADRWNRDHAWFSREEARAWLPTDPRIGAKHDLPKMLLHRLARFHLVDNVRGQTLPFAPAEVRNAQIQTEVTQRIGDRVHLRITGRIRTSAGKEWLLKDTGWTPRSHAPHGVETKLLGRAVYDLSSSAFTSFELIALGRRQGYTEMNARGRGPGGGPIGFVFTLAPRTPAHRVAPAFVDVYGAAWIRRPTGE